MSYWTDMRTPTEAELVVGFYDLTNYTAFGQRATPLQVLDVMTRYHAFAGQLFHAAGGILIKTAGDAGLFAFRDIDADKAVQAAVDLQTEGDQWLGEVNYKGRVRTVMHFGPCALGMIGGPGREMLDIMGKTVNIVGAMRTEGYLALTPALFRRLGPETRTRFKKHTPPVSYIGVEDPCPRTTT